MEFLQDAAETNLERLCAALQLDGGSGSSGGAATVAPELVTPLSQGLGDGESALLPF